MDRQESLHRHAARARRSEPLTAAAEVQWDLLPPLTCSTEEVALSGILEPAYDIGGDSFDYAFDETSVDFTIVDAIGHGMSAVLMSAAAIDSLRNSRRARGTSPTPTRSPTGRSSTQFGDSSFVTGIIGTLDLASGTLTWINAGHVLPMLVRNGTYAGPTALPSVTPLGLGGPVVEVAEARYSRAATGCSSTPTGSPRPDSSDGTFFGDDRLADFLVRASLERLPATRNRPARRRQHPRLRRRRPTRRRPTMLLLEHHPPPS